MMSPSSGGPPLEARVHAELSRGGFQSGAALARTLGVSRSAVWKAVTALREHGVTLHAVRNRGYRIAAPCEPFDAAKIRVGLAVGVAGRVRHIEQAWSVESTNGTLLARPEPPPGLCDVLVADHQTAGRGRRGRLWLAPPGGALCLSAGWSFLRVPRDLGALGLAAGVCTLRALRRRADSVIQLKWPNDLTIGDRKLGGILVEMRAEAGGSAYAVIGIGINLSLGAVMLERVAAAGTRATDLKEAGADPTPRNSIVADIVGELVQGLAEFESRGLRPFTDEWRAADALRGRAIDIRDGDTSTHGVARGIDIGGALLVETREGLRKLVVGDVSVRPEA